MSEKKRTSDASSENVDRYMASRMRCSEGQLNAQWSLLTEEERAEVIKRNNDVPDPRTETEFSEVFVFGSNLAGRHGKGAASYAKQHYGAIYGQGVGPQGQSYAIPTKDRMLRTLPLDVIRAHVKDFLFYAEKNPKVPFKVTAIGCGLAGYTPEQIAPMFKEAPSNCTLPAEFLAVLGRPTATDGPCGRCGARGGPMRMQGDFRHCIDYCECTARMRERKQRGNRFADTIEKIVDAIEARGGTAIDGPEFRDAVGDALRDFAQGLRRESPRPTPARPTAQVTFEEAWAEMEAQGYQYGEDALQGVRFGWEIRGDVEARRDPAAEMAIAIMFAEWVSKMAVRMFWKTELCANGIHSGDRGGCEYCGKDE